MTKVHTFSETKIIKLQKLDSLGSEIGCHRLNHSKATEYLKSHPLQEYFDFKILPAIKFMDQLNLHPTSFSYPNGMNCDSLDNFLLNYFDILRDVTDEQWKPLTKEVKKIIEIFCKKGKTNVVSGLGIDINFKIDEVQLRSAFLRIKQNNKRLTLYAHCPIYSNAQNYQIEIEYLENLIYLLDEYDLPTFKISELVD